MRHSLLVLGALALTVSAAGTAALDVRGTARAGDRPQPNAVIWLDLPNARLERLDYDTTSPFILFARRAMAGARIRIPGGLTAQIAAGHQWRQQIQRDRTALDLSLTYPLRHDVETHRQ